MLEATSARNIEFRAICLRKSASVVVDGQLLSHFLVFGLFQDVENASLCTCVCLQLSNIPLLGSHNVRMVNALSLRQIGFLRLRLS